ncbi:hypothetical protein EDB84DRAFT_1572667, partial [Lactarius hengduanensis]
MGLLGAMIRGALRSPTSLRTGPKPTSGHMDPFPIHHELDRPLTEGGAIMLMCQQLGGLFASNSNHPDSSYPDSYFIKLLTTLGKSSNRLDPPETSKASAAKAAHEALAQVYREQIRLDAVEMNNIKEAVKMEIFAALNQEALADEDHWRAVYKNEFIEAMHAAMEHQNPGLHADKGKAPLRAPPVTISQVVRDAEPAIRAEVQARAACLQDELYREVKRAFKSDDTYWTGEPMRKQLAKDIRAEQHAEVEALLAPEREKLRQEIQAEITASLEYEKTQLRKQAEDDLECHKFGMAEQCKIWKVKYRNARTFSFVRTEAHRLGYALTPSNEAALAREAQAFKAYALEPLLVDGYELSSSPPSRAPSTAPEGPCTPPNPSSRPDPNVTPTPVRTKRARNSEELPAPKALFPSNFILDSSSPVEEDQMKEDDDYALEVVMQNNGGLPASIHAHSRAVSTAPIAPSPIPAHNPSDPPRAVALSAQLEQLTTAPLPAVVSQRPSQVEDVALAPSTAALDGLTSMMTQIYATIQRLEGRMDSQDQCIADLAKSRDPRPRPTGGEKAKAAGAVAALPQPNTSVTSNRSREMDETLSHTARVDDPSRDPSIELSTDGALGVAKPTPPAANANGKPAPSTTLPASWANIVTQKASNQHTSAASLSRAVTQGTGRTPGGKSRPETVARRAKSGTTEVTVIRNLGVDDTILEATLLKLPPSHIVAEARTEIERLSGNSLVLLGGRWSTNKTAHNFVYSFRD